MAEKPIDREALLDVKLAELDLLIEAQKQRMATVPSTSLDQTLEKIFAKQTETQQAIIESQRTIHRQNPQHPGKSAFSHPEGDVARPKATLKYRETFLNGHREREDELTPAEIDAFNQFTHSCAARGGDVNKPGADGWTAIVAGHRLIIDVPAYTQDNRNNLPDGLVLILNELAQGARAVTPASMAERIAELERKLATGAPA